MHQVCLVSNCSTFHLFSLETAATDGEIEDEEGPRVEHTDWEAVLRDVRLIESLLESRHEQQAPFPLAPCLSLRSAPFSVRFSRCDRHGC